MSTPRDLDGLVALLEREGFVAAGEEAQELLAAAGGDGERLDGLLARRRTGEPLAWITGGVVFCGLALRVDPGVYVPRWQTEALAQRAAARLRVGGVAVDVCTGCGAIAAVLQARRPDARVLAADLDPRAVANARANGVDARVGDLLASFDGPLDLVVGVVPYVPTPELHLLQRDTFTFESALAYDGGADGTDLLRRVAVGAAGLLAPGGALLLELGGGQGAALAAQLPALGYQAVSVLHDEDGDVRGLEATAGP